MTDPCYRFFREHNELGDFLGFVTRLAKVTDQNAEIAIKALYEKDNPDEYEKRMSTVAASGALIAFHGFRTLVVEMMICRATDNYLAYISELLSAIFRTKPEALRSSDKIQVDWVLRNSTMEQLISAITDRKVHELSYQSVDKLSEYVKEKLGLDLFETPEEKLEIVRIVEIRNLIIHARAIVNERYLLKVPDCPTSVGNKLPLDKYETFEMVYTLRRNVESLDKRAIDKFGLTYKTQAP